MKSLILAVILIISVGITLTWIGLEEQNKITPVIFDRVMPERNNSENKNIPDKKIIPEEECCNIMISVREITLTEPQDTDKEYIANLVEQIEITDRYVIIVR